MTKNNSRLSKAQQLLGMTLARHLKAQKQSKCLSSLEIAVLVEGNVNKKNRDRMMTHLASCHNCRETFLLSLDISEIKRTKEIKLKPLFRPLPLAASIVLLFISLLILFQAEIFKKPLSEFEISRTVEKTNEAVISSDESDSHKKSDSGEKRRKPTVTGFPGRSKEIAQDQLAIRGKQKKSADIKIKDRESDDSKTGQPAAIKKQETLSRPDEFKTKRKLQEIEEQETSSKSLSFSLPKKGKPGLEMTEKADKQFPCFFNREYASMDSPTTKETVTYCQYPPKAIKIVIPEKPGIQVEDSFHSQIDTEIDIDNQGNVRKVCFLSGNQSLKNVLVKAILQWKFEPFKVKDKSFPARFILSFQFSREKGWQY